MLATGQAVFAAGNGYVVGVEQHGDEIVAADQVDQLGHLVLSEHRQGAAIAGFWQAPPCAECCVDVVGDLLLLGQVGGTLAAAMEAILAEDRPAVAATRSCAYNS